MEDSRVYDDSHMKNVLLKNDSTSEVLDSIWVPNTSSSFHGSASIVNFENQFENCNDELELDHRPEKKRRLAPNQVQFLEKSFEVENKLEPDRKLQLAKELGLQPRQVAIWFQNRRARCKTKVLEKEYDCLKANYDKIKTDYETLSAENEKLKNEVNLLNQKLVMRENGKSDQEPCDPISPLDFGPKIRFLSQKITATSARSDVLDSDSPHGTLEPADSSHVFESSDFSQDEDESLLQPPEICFPKLEIECCDDLQPNFCNLGFPVQDHGTWFWQY